MADIICAFPHGGARGGPPEREVVSFSIFLPDGAPSLPPSNPTPKFRRRFRFSILVFSPEAGRQEARQAGKAEKATDGWIERLVQRWSYLVTRVYDFETHLN